MDPEKAVSEGRTYLKNAEDALGRDVSDEEELYIWENQVDVIDQFLANTEDVDGGSELDEIREDLRSVKKDLEKKTMEFLGEGEPPEPSEEEMVESMIAFAEEFLPDVDAAIEAEVDDVENIDIWETPLAVINSWLADSEPYKEHDDLAQVRQDVKERKAALEANIDDVVSEWRAAELEAD